MEILSKHEFIRVSENHYHFILKETKSESTFISVSKEGQVYSVYYLFENRDTISGTTSFFGFFDSLEDIIKLTQLLKKSHNPEFDVPKELKDLGFKKDHPNALPKLLIYESKTDEKYFYGYSDKTITPIPLTIFNFNKKTGDWTYFDLGETDDPTKLIELAILLKEINK